MEISFRNIVEINEEGLKFQYYDRVRFIDFLSCSERWKTYANSLNDDQKGYAESELSCIGQRDSGSTPMYIEIFGKERIRIVFDIKKPLPYSFLGFGNDRQYREFRKVSDAIFSKGWSTLDLS